MRITKKRYLQSFLIVTVVLAIVRLLFPSIASERKTPVAVQGNEEDMARFEEDIEKMRKHVVKYNSITDEDILDIIKGRQTKADAVKDVLVYSISGRPIKSRSENQQRLIDAFNKNDMIFAVGPAGTGKTYLSIALAVKALKEKTAKRIILSRPAVEAGEKLGFLPGDIKVTQDEAGLFMARMAVNGACFYASR